MSAPARRPDGILVLVCLALALGGPAGRPAEAEDAAPSPGPSSVSWLLLDAVEGGPRAPFRPSQVLSRYLVRAGAQAPVAGEVVRGAGGREAVWRQVEPTPEGVLEPGDAAWAFAEVHTATSGVFEIDLSRVSAAFVNGVPVYGDVYGYGSGPMPVRLEAGANAVFLMGFRGPLRLGILPPRAPLYVAATDPTLPDLVRGQALAPRAAVLVVNATERALRRIFVEARVVVDSASCSAGATLSVVLPLGQMKVPLDLPPLRVPPDASEARLEVELADCDGTLDRQTFPLALRDVGEPHRRTFVSAIDGSVQFYGLRPPAPNDAGVPDEAPQLVLSLHGASVDALNQARAYSARPRVVIVAPTNRRPFGFDWQDWGRRDAYEVLADVLTATGADRRSVCLTGHSMGGHGTWHLAANDAVAFAAIAPSAAWVSFGTYAGGLPDGPLARLWRAADPASDTLALVQNLAHLPIRQLHGAADDNVPVTEAYRMRDALSGLAADYALEVIEGKGHWWDGDAAPGADCVDWPAFFACFAGARIPDDPSRVRFRTVDPGVDARDHWVAVEQPLRYGEPLAVEAERDDETRTVRVQTENVGWLRLDLGHEPQPTTVVLDGRRFPLGAVEPSVDFYRSHAAGPWRLGGDGDDAKRASRSGPFKRVFDRRFVLVHGTAGDDAEDARSLARARFDAQRWRYRANGTVEVISDADLLAAPRAYEGRNVVLYGNATTNRAWDEVFDSRLPLRLEDGRARIGERVFEAGDLAALFCFPRRGDGEALAGAVAWTGPVGERITIPSLYFASGVGYPDYVLFGPEVLTRGDEGVRAAGFFDRSWRLAE